MSVDAGQELATFPDTGIGIGIGIGIGMNVMLINTDPDNDATVELSYDGFTPSSATPTVHSYLKNADSIDSATAGSATTRTAPAYSIVVVQLKQGS